MLCFKKHVKDIFHVMVYAFLMLQNRNHENIQEIFIIKEVMLGEDLKLSDVGH